MVARLCTIAARRVGQRCAPIPTGWLVPTSRHVASLIRAPESSVVRPPEERPNLVILGTGWAAVNLLKNLNDRVLSQYRVLVCSPLNHFTNTPLLPSVTVGTLEPRSVAEPIRNIIDKKRKRNPDAFLKFNELEATEIDPKKKRVKMETRTADGRDQLAVGINSKVSSIHETSFWMDYDVLVCATGATTNTFGTPGAMENCCFLKTVQDAMLIRNNLLDSFETAAILSISRPPGLDPKIIDAEIDRLLTFVVIGAGPTGVEIAAEIHDFVNDDILPRYKGFSDRKIRVQIVEMGKGLLGTYDKLIQDYAEKRFMKLDIEMFTSHQVKKVNAKSVEALDLATGELKTLPFGVCVWASGVRPQTVTLDLAKNLQGSRILETDGNLRVLGAEGSIFGLGDNAKVTSFIYQERRNSVKAAAQELFKEADVNGDGSLDQDEFHQIVLAAQKKYPQFEGFLGVVSRESIAQVYEKRAGGENKITYETFLSVCEEVDRSMKNLPPTAQVASQQGEYLAKIINNVPFEELGHTDGFEPVFEYKHAGSMAYIGGEHAAIDSPELGVQTGLFTYVIWKGVYWSKAVSLRNKIQLVFDWAKSWFLGRDTSRF